MTSAGWDDVRVDFESAKDHFQKAVKLFEKKGFDKESLDGYQAEMALMHSMQSGYTSFENGLKRVFNIIGEDLPVGDSSHSDLLKRAAREIKDNRPAIISKDLYSYADELRRFRHIAVRTYDNFSPKESEKSISSARKFSEIILTEINAFQSILEEGNTNNNSKDNKSTGPK